MLAVGVLASGAVVGGGGFLPAGGGAVVVVVVVGVVGWVVVVCSLFSSSFDSQLRHKKKTWVSSFFNSPHNLKWFSIGTCTLSLDFGMLMQVIIVNAASLRRLHGSPSLTRSNDHRIIGSHRLRSCVTIIWLFSVVQCMQEKRFSLSLFFCFSLFFSRSESPSRSEPHKSWKSFNRYEPHAKAA